ncbi:MAG: glycosyltransferase [Parvibaculum sp.]|uniref:glycosyltransferase n=1 Tax=Parvibaculum sp. TaxID=2024848 RepID=UPI0025F3EF0A|nr:glycosyltransferase [Parvibaculum sp.]MCE9649114.1 glycosyltransferase [Parvibaculum sp.]
MAQDSKVLIALGSSALFGAERRFFKIIRYLQDKDDVSLDVLLVVNSSLYRPASQVPWIGQILESLSARKRLCVVPDKPSHLFDMRGLAGFLYFFLFAKTAHCVLRGRLVAYLRALLGLPVFFEVTSPDIAARVGLGLPFFFLKRIRFICVSPSISRRFVQDISKRLSAAQVEQVDVTHASIPFFEGEDRHLRPEEKQPWIVSASRFLERKNVVLFAECVKDAIADLEGWKIFILGQGPMEGAIRKVLGAEISAGHVVVGYDPKIAETIARSSLYVSLIEPDNYPSQSILEAMAFGNALLLSDTGNSKKFLNDDLSNGMLVPLDRKKIGDALKFMASSMPALVSMGRKSQATVRERFSHDVYMKEFIDRHVG